MKGELSAILAKRDANVYLSGNRVDDCYDDDELAVLGEWPVESCSLSKQRITRLPPLQPSLKSLSVFEHGELASLDGIERLTSLQSLTLGHLPCVDFERAFELLVELPELTELRLYGEGWRAVPRSIAKLPSLVEIMIDHAPSFDLAPAFATLGEVATLRNVRVWIWEKVVPDALAPLQQIEVLDMRGKGEVFPPSVGTLARLQKLVLERSKFGALPPEIGALQRLVELDIQGNPIAVLPDEVCECANLEVLSASGTLLKTLPAQIGKLQKLRVLGLSTKKLKSLPPSIGDLAELRELNLPWSDKSKLVVPDSLYNLRLEKFFGPSAIQKKLTLRPPPTPELDRVVLYDRARIPADFGDPVELELNLPERTEPLPQLSQLRRLKDLTLDVGDLDDALRRVASAEYLRSLAIKGEMTEIPDSLGELVQLEWLLIDSGSRTMTTTAGTLRVLTEAIGKLAQLRTLTIERHAMTALPDSLGQLAALKSFVVRANALAALPDSIGQLAGLDTLGISAAHKLRELPSSLSGCTALETLGISDSELAATDLTVVGALPALKTLSLVSSRGFDLAAILDALAGGPLETLNLRYTRITELPASIGALSKLRVLDLEATNLKRFPAALRDCTELRWISLPSLYDMDRDVRDNIKAHLPQGRWKKHHRGYVTWYERSA